MFYLNFIILLNYDSTLRFTGIIFTAGIGSVLGVGCYPSLAIGIGTGEERNGIRTCLAKGL